MRVHLFLLAVFVCVAAIGESPAGAAGKKPIERQKFCPVFTDRIIGPNSRSLRYKGIEVYFSSDLAARKWMRDPVSYLDVDVLPQLKGLTLLERQFKQRYCPVHPQWKVSVKDPSVIYQGHRVYLFDKQALKVWNSAPEKFFDLEILTQFPRPEMPPGDGKKNKPASP